MKSVRSRLILILIFIGVGVYYLYPTYKYQKLSKEEQAQLVSLAAESAIPLNRLATDVYRDDVDLRAEIEASNLDTLQKASAIEKLDYMRGPFLEGLKTYRPKAIKLGLDLQGGMYLVLEVDVVQLLDNTAKGKDEIYDRIMNQLRDASKRTDVDVFESLRSLAARENASLSRYWGEAGQTNDAILDDLRKAASDGVDRSLQILRNRIDQFGVSEPSISKLGTQRIALELPGVKDPARARELVGRTAQLKFHILVEPERARDILTRLDAAIAAMATGQTPSDTLTAAKTDNSHAARAKTDTTKKLTTDLSKKDTNAANLLTSQATDTTDTSGLAHPLLSLFVGGTSDILVPADNRSKVMRILASRENQRYVPADVQFLWSSKGRVTGSEQKEFWTLFLVKKQAELTGNLLSNAQASIGSGYDPEQAGRPVVNIEFNREGARIFSRVTGANVGKRLAIVLDEKVYMAPNIRDKIPGGQAIITGLDDMPEAQDIALVLRAGALPAPVHVIQERTVGPSLGQDSVAAGQFCLFLSFAAVVLFMLWYYRASGSIADLAMITNMFLLLAVLAMFQFTLTLPGIAGMILTIGMAVDANVLIFERIREELALGKTVRAAIDTGFTRAFAVIVDANMTTAFSGVALLIYGSGSIKGFALTLTVGIVVNVFTAVFVTRLIYDWSTQRRQLKTLSI
jgi:preprotein translocase subunit SecD